MRPFALLLINIFFPVLDRSRARNPTRRCRISRDGRFMFMYLRGPHRIWEARPHSAGWEVMDVLGTTSAAGPAAAAVRGLVVVGGWRRVVVVGRLLKTGEEGDDVLGRRRGREEKDLG